MTNFRIWRVDATHQEERCVSSVKARGSSRASRRHRLANWDQKMPQIKGAQGRRMRWSSCGDLRKPPQHPRISLAVQGQVVEAKQMVHSLIFVNFSQKWGVVNVYHPLQVDVNPPRPALAWLACVTRPKLTIRIARVVELKALKQLYY